MRRLVSLVLVASCFAACGDDGRAGPSDGDGAASADVSLDPKSVATWPELPTEYGAFKASGGFSTAAGGVRFTLEVSGAPPGEHGVHIHENGDCSAADATSAGGHWNPGMHMHGDLTSPSTTHLGDLGNIMIGRTGSGSLEVENTDWTIGDGATSDVLGKAVVIHAKVDDLVTQADADAGVTPGNAGARIACGVITRGR